MNTHRGAVYFIQHRGLTSHKPHYLVVLNLDPESDSCIVFGVVTSGIERARERVRLNRQPESTLVVVTPRDYAGLDHDSVIDCNTPITWPAWEFRASYAQINAARRTDMPQHICNAVVQGVLASSMVPLYIKKLLSSE